MNASDVAVAELAIAPGDLAGDGAPSAALREGPVRIRHLGMTPSVHPEAYVAPTAVLSGQVSVGGRLFTRAQVEPCISSVIACRQLLL